MHTSSVLLAIVFSTFCFSNVSSVRSQGGTHRHIGFRSDNARLESVPRDRPLLRGGNEPSLPAKISLRRYVPKAGDQGLHPTDAAWAVAYAGLTCMKAKDQDLSNATRIDSLAFSPGFVSAIVMAEHHTTCEQGISLLNALEATLRVGAVPLREFPYECQMEIPVWLKARARRNRITAFSRLFDPGEPEKNFAIKRSLAEEKPVLAGLRYVESFLDGDDVWRPSPVELASESGGNDTIVAVTVIGYDDTMLGGSYELMASLGADWGSAGFARITYASFEKLCEQAFVMYNDTSSLSVVGETVPSIDTTATSTEPEWTGTVTFLDVAGTPMPIVREGDIFRFVRSYRTNDAFRIQVQLDQEAYVYAFVCDSTSARPTLIFPDSTITLSNSLQPNTLLTIPDPSGRSYCAFDSTVGTDFICLVFSRGQQDIKAFCRDMEFIAGSIEERVVAALGGDCLRSEEIQSTEGEGVRWWTLNKDRSIVAVVFALTHVRS